MPIWLTDDEHRTLAAALDCVIPGDGISPGAGEVGGADYVDLLLGAFAFDPPRIWAGGPFSGRHGGEASFDKWLELSRVEELAWRMRIEGSQGLPEREFNGPLIGWQEQYRTGLGEPRRRLPRSRSRRASDPRAVRRQELPHPVVHPCLRIALRRSDLRRQPRWRGMGCHRLRR